MIRAFLELSEWFAENDFDWDKIKIIIETPDAERMENTLREGILSRYPMIDYHGYPNSIMGIQFKIEETEI